MDSQPPLPGSDTNTTAWPRRAAKACASCRRDKIRCDGDRPCSGCTKKGFTAEQCIDGCEQCRRARVRCEGGKPCQRCRDMQFECIDESTMAPMRQDPSARMAARALRPKPSDRAKLACQACRRDNKKCEDQRPCSRCINRGEDCIHVTRGPKLVKLRCEGCRKGNKKCEDMRPCRYCVEEKLECISAVRKGRGHGTRVMAACTNCRRDKIRCEGMRPCAACVRKGYECVDRACKTCTQKGIGTECTHRKAYDAGSSDDDRVDHEHLNMNVHPSASTSIPVSGPTHAEMPHPLLPPMSYAPYGYTVPHYYQPAQSYAGPPVQPHQHQQHLGPPEGMYQPHPGERAVYFPVIDPHLEPPGTSSERFGPLGGADPSMGRPNDL